MPHAADSKASERRLAQLVKDEFAFVWRTLRRFGLSQADADDSAQQVFLVASKKLDQINVGSERSFLFGTALRIASRSRRTLRRRREVDSAELEEREDPTPDLDTLLDQRRARALLDDILDALSEDLRAVFVLYEIEQMTMSEIASLMEIPAGTVASRLRRARDAFAAAVARKKAASLRAPATADVPRMDASPASIGNSGGGQ